MFFNINNYCTAIEKKLKAQSMMHSVRFWQKYRQNVQKKPKNDSNTHSTRYHQYT